MTEMAKTFLGKTKDEHLMDMVELRESHKEWRENLHKEKTGFFPVFSNQIKPYIQDLSGNAIRLYIYLGIHSNNETGEVMGTNPRMMQQFFDCQLRTLQKWLEELEQANLIRRIQPAYKTKMHIFILPYSTSAHYEWKQQKAE